MNPIGLTVIQINQKVNNNEKWFLSGGQQFICITAGAEHLIVVACLIIVKHGSGGAFHIFKLQVSALPPQAPIIHSAQCICYTFTIPDLDRHETVLMKCS